MCLVQELVQMHVLIVPIGAVAHRLREVWPKFGHEMAKASNISHKYVSIKVTFSKACSVAWSHRVRIKIGLAVVSPIYFQMHWDQGW